MVSPVLSHRGCSVLALCSRSNFSTIFSLLFFSGIASPLASGLIARQFDQHNEICIQSIFLVPLVLAVSLNSSSGFDSAAFHFFWAGHHFILPMFSIPCLICSFSLQKTLARRG
ncbi:hypothetical protein EDC04DRAFT_1330531 [Pisolithus marmoratus]|nr:hypothetical protein EDC04DRAFT_1330531 [Pisolithus marmoratus]